MARDDESQGQNKASHISYKDYKKMLNTNTKKQSLTLFLGAFFVLLLIFLGMAKMMSPDVEITLGDDTNVVAEEEYPRGEIDDRLRDLQMEDESMSFNTDEVEVEDGEKVTIPKIHREHVEENKLPEEVLGQKAVKDVVGETARELPKSTEKVQDKTSAQQAETSAPVLAPAPPVPAAPAINARVVVGNYPTIEQADVAKSILQDAGLGVNPFIRKMGNTYTLQVGSYGTKEKAMSVAESLLNQNFPAKVIVEQK